MYIVQIAAECAPVAKVGGLADVVYGLSRELETRGHTVDIILPKYDCLRYDQIYYLEKDFNDLWVPWYGGSIHCTVFRGKVHGRQCFFIEPHSQDNFFNRGRIYGFNDEVNRFAFFSRAALEYMLKSGKRPEIIHVHDWQTGLVPVFLYEIYAHIGMWKQRVCYTIHNFRHQGVTGGDILRATNLHRPEHYLSPDRLRDPANANAINCMKGGIVYSNFTVTVSPKHAFEARHSDQSFGLGHVLHQHQGKFGGVLNGIDYDVWNPEVDRFLVAKFGPKTLDDKYKSKTALRQRFMLREGLKPIVCYVGRLDSQKAIHLIRHAIFFTLQKGGQFVLLGSSPDQAINNEFWGLKRHLNDNQDCHLELGFNEELSHLIYAGSDMLVMPSHYEPCGLTQLIAMKYGTVPIVRAVGGLIDTVFDRDHASCPVEQRNGYVFHQTDNAALESAMSRAFWLFWNSPEDFRKLMVQGMAQDWSWKNPGEHYLNIYELIRHK